MGRSAISSTSADMQRQEENAGSLMLAKLIAAGMVIMGKSWIAPVFEWAGYILGFLALLLLVKLCLRRAVFRWRLRRALRGPGAFGDGKLAQARVLKAAGMIGRKAGEGLFLGAFDGHLLFYQPETHLLTIAPAGQGKTSCLAAPNLLAMTALAPAYGFVATDKGGDLAAMCWTRTRERLPASACLNAYHLHDLPNHCFNPIGDVATFGAAGSPETIEAARGKMLIVVPEPAQSGDSKYFRDAARDLGSMALSFKAFDDPERCTLPDLCEAVHGGHRDLRRLFLDMQSSTAADGFIARAGRRWEDFMDEGGRTFESVISELQQALAPWDPYSTLGRSRRHSDFDPLQLKDGPAGAFLVVPEDKVLTAAKDIALCVDALIGAVMRHPKKHPRVVFLLDEFQRLPVMPSIPAALFRGRGSGLTLWPIVQDAKALRAYGKEESAFFTQADVVQYFGIRDPDDAARLELRIGQTTLRTTSVSVPQESGKESYSISYGEQAAPVLRKDQILQLGQGKQLIVYRDKPVILADIVPWWLVDPWCRWPDDNPQEGGRPNIRPRYFMRYRGL